MTEIFPEFDIVQRTKGGNALKMCAYQSCSEVHSPTTIYDFTRKAAEHMGTIMMLPAGAPTWAADPATLWARVTAAEVRADAQEARMIAMPIPRAVPAGLREEYVRHLLQPYVDQGMIAQADIHCTTATDGGEQPHVHVMLTMRELDASTDTGFSRKKAREWNDQFADFQQGKKKTAIRSASDQIIGRVNEFCADRGIEFKADSRPLGNAAQTADLSRDYQAGSSPHTAKATRPNRLPSFSLSATPAAAATARPPR